MPGCSTFFLKKDNTNQYNIKFNGFIYQFIYWMQSPTDTATVLLQTMTVKKLLQYKSWHNSQILNSELQRTPWYSHALFSGKATRIFVAFVTIKQSISHSINLLHCESPSFFSYVNQEAVNNDDVKNYCTLRIRVNTLVIWTGQLTPLAAIVPISLQPRLDISAFRSHSEVFNRAVTARDWWRGRGRKEV